MCLKWSTRGIVSTIVSEYTCDKNLQNKTGKVTNIRHDGKRLSNIVRYKFDYNTKDVNLILQLFRQIMYYTIKLPWMSHNNKGCNNNNNICI